jgi:hypothetical protein
MKYEVIIDGQQEQIEAKNANELSNFLVKKMKEIEAVKAWILVKNRVDTITQDGFSYHWNHVGFKFNTTGYMEPKELLEFFRKQISK